MRVIPEPLNGTARYLVRNYDAQVITREEALTRHRAGSAIICIEDTGLFDRTYYCDEEGDVQAKVMESYGKWSHVLWVAMRPCFADEISEPRFEEAQI